MLGQHPSQRIDALAHDMVESSLDSDTIRMSEEISALMNELRDFLFDRVYIGSIAKTEEDKAVRVLQSLGGVLSRPTRSRCPPSSVQRRARTWR